MRENDDDYLSTTGSGDASSSDPNLPIASRVVRGSSQKVSATKKRDTQPLQNVAASRRVSKYDSDRLREELRKISTKRAAGRPKSSVVEAVGGTTAKQVQPSLLSFLDRQLLLRSKRETQPRSPVPPDHMSITMLLWL